MGGDCSELQGGNTWRKRKEKGEKQTRLGLYLTENGPAEEITKDEKTWADDLIREG